MWESNNMRLSRYIFFAFMLLIASCKKDYIYTVNDVTATQPGEGKTNVKTTTEFISIAYADLYSSSIPTDSLVGISTAYEAFGDKKLIEDMIVRHFLHSPAIQLPTDASMRTNVGQFVEDAILKFYNRKPDAFEKFFISDIIKKNTAITPAMVYYALMTSDEYRYY